MPAEACVLEKKEIDLKSILRFSGEQGKVGSYYSLTLKLYRPKNHKSQNFWAEKIKYKNISLQNLDKISFEGMSVIAKILDYKICKIFIPEMIRR